MAEWADKWIPRPNTDLPWDELDDGSQATFLRQARVALSAAAEGPEPKYQWGIRTQARDIDGGPFGAVPCDDEEHARALFAVQRGGWELVRWIKAGPVEVVSDGE